MSCVICLDASADARRVCGCSARACPACLLGLLDRGKDRCVVCGGRFIPTVVVRACQHGLQNPDGGGDQTKAYVKLAIAYSSAGKPRRALRSLAIAQHHAPPGHRWEHFLELEIESSLLAIGHTADADRCLRKIMPRILEMPQTRSAGMLYAECCKLLCKMNAQIEKKGAARSWLRRAMEAEESLQLDGSLANSLQLDAQILSSEGKFQLAKESLVTAAHIMSLSETDECLRCKVQVDIAISEVEMGEFDPAPARLLGVLPALRRKRDYHSARLLPVAAQALSCIVTPKRRLRRKTILRPSYSAGGISRWSD